MPRCARSTTSLVWGIPVHPTYLLRAIRTHERLLPLLRALRGCHMFAPDPPSEASHRISSSFTVTTPAAPFAVAVANFGGPNAATVLSASATFSFTPISSPRYPASCNISAPSTPLPPAPTSAATPAQGSVVQRKGIASLPVEILDLIEVEIRLNAHEEDVPRSLAEVLERAGMKEGGEHSHFPGWRRICVCGERYEETLDVVRCREKVMAQVGGKDTQVYLLKYFGLTTAVISTPLKHSLVLLTLPMRVSTWLAPLTSISTLPMHPPIPKQTLSSYPRDASTLTGGRLPMSKSYLRRFSSLPPPVIPLVTPSDDFVGHLHPGMFAQNHWRLRNQNSGMRASIVDPAYLLLTDDKIRRFRWCVEELVLWRAVRIAREELGYEELGRIEHFEMALPPKQRSSNEGVEAMGGEDVDPIIEGWESLGDEDREKRVKVEEDAGDEAMKSREKNYWNEAIKPSLWLLEELTYEP